jgi:hypothetical protein
MVGKLMPLGCIAMLAVGCSAKSQEGSFANAPEIKTPLSSEQSMQRRGMSSDEMANERAAQAASMSGGGGSR